MIKKLFREFAPNPFDKMIKQALKKQKKSFLIAWNRGLGDIPLGLYAMEKRIKEFIPDSTITFLIRKNLEEGFLLFPSVHYLVAPNWVRGEEIDVSSTLQSLNIDKKTFDVIIENPDPAYWVRWQHKKLVPKLVWKEEFDSFVHRFPSPGNKIRIAIQPFTETPHGPWRNWTEKKWNDLFFLLDKTNIYEILLFGMAPTPTFSQKCIIDLRGKTSFLEALSLIKNTCNYLIVPDSGILSTIYYIDTPFPIKIISLWGDVNQGILKQAVPSPNPMLDLTILIGDNRNLNTISPNDILEALTPFGAQ